MNKEIFKKVATEFFYYWWNEEGNNTAAGFDKWWNDKGQELVNNLDIPVVSNCYHLTDKQLEKVKKLNSKEVQFTSGGGIGVTIRCKDEHGEWWDITDYDKW